MLFGCIDNRKCRLFVSWNEYSYFLLTHELLEAKNDVLVFYQTFGNVYISLWVISNKQLLNRMIIKFWFYSQNEFCSYYIRQYIDWTRLHPKLQKNDFP